MSNRYSSVANRCLVCNKRIWWHWLTYRACRMAIGKDIIYLCSEDCYGTLLSAYEEGLASIVYGVDQP